MTERAPLLPLARARAILRRAVDKAEDYGQAGTYVVVDEAGTIVTSSRMDGAGVQSFAVSRAKAYGASVHRISSGLLTNLYCGGPAIQFQAMQEVSNKKFFPGPGAQLIQDAGKVVGAITTGMGIPPFVQLPGVPPEKFVVDGKPGNAEDICAAYALQKPYEGQRGDDAEAWLKAYGNLPDFEGTGLNEVPPSTRQVELDAAIALCDAAMAEARRQGVLVSVAVVDRNGDMVQIDRMDHAAPMTPDLALALAITAVNFGGNSADAACYPSFAALAHVTPYKFLPVPGGIAMIEDGLIVGALGIGGVDPQVCQAIAQAAIAHRQEQMVPA